MMHAPEFPLARSVVALALLVVAGCGGGAGDAHQTFATDFPPPEGRALRIDDYYVVRSVGGVALRPDGVWVAYTVSTPVEETNETRTESWIVRSDGSTGPRRITHRGADVRSPEWTDAGLLRYQAEGAAWTLDVDAAGARPVRYDGGPPDNVSPDGTWIAVLEDVPAAEPGADLSDFERRHEERFAGVQFDWLGFQRDGAPFPAPDPTARPAQELVLRPLDADDDRAGANGERRLTSLGFRPSDVTWHPDSRVLAFIADDTWRDELVYGSPDIWTVTIDGEVTRLTDDGYSYGDLAYSPDGRHLAFTRSFSTDMIIEQRLAHGGPDDLYVWPAGAAQPLNLTPDWDLDPGQPRWSPDGRWIYFTAGIGGATHLFRVAPDGTGVEQVTTGERRLGGLRIDRDFTTLAYTVGLFETPADVYAADIDGSNERRLTDVHRALTREIAFGRAERLLFRSADGTPVEGWLLYPYSYDPAGGPYPLIVHSHGGPHSASGYGFDFKHQLFAANGYFVLQTNFRSSTGYGHDFKWATWGAWGDRDGEDVMAGVDYAIANFAIDPARVASIGHSYGGFMTNWLITHYPDRFVAAASGAGISNWVSDYGTADIARTKETEFFGTPWMPEALARMNRQSPLMYADRVRAATLFVHGEVDQRVPYTEAEQMYVALKKNGVPAKVIQYEGMPHGIRGHWNQVHRAMNELRWFDAFMKGD